MLNLWLSIGRAWHSRYLFQLSFGTGLHNSTRSLLLLVSSFLLCGIFHTTHIHILHNLKCIGVLYIFHIQHVAQHQKKSIIKLICQGMWFMHIGSIVRALWRWEFPILREFWICFEWNQKIYSPGLSKYSLHFRQIRTESKINTGSIWQLHFVLIIYIVHMLK